ncbi:MAG: hypothetical protein BGO47_02130 [Microbacterium sp. 67-17]|uniref:hypothetical protein n=1 Tax=Microbacterium sp. 67-17 TaxID=1895782 RepID=UPI000962B7C1|nr:hypothetical protein [Microbacterium sp. 67-17]OJW00628.1 MAG: hypothetical protein BGO47_02130 [Microbacterium sp. 67-17]
MVLGDRTEWFAEEVIRRVSGLPVIHFDDGSRPRMVDALISDDGALEVTVIAEQGALQTLSFSTKLDAPNLAGWWELRYPHGRIDRRKAARHAPVLAQFMETAGFTDSDDCTELISALEAGQWLMLNSYRLHRYVGASRGGRIDVLPRATAGFIDEYLTGLSDWVMSLTGGNQWRNKAQKLAASGKSRLHLALIVHESGAPFEIWSGLWDATEVRSSPLSGIEPITDVWVIGTAGTPAVKWSRERGWEVLPYERDLGHREEVAD